MDRNIIARVADRVANARFWSTAVDCYVRAAIDNSITACTCFDCNDIAGFTARIGDVVIAVARFNQNLIVIRTIGRVIDGNCIVASAGLDCTGSRISAYAYNVTFIGTGSRICLQINNESSTTSESNAVITTGADD